MATKKTASRSTAKQAAKRTRAPKGDAPKSMPKAGRDPKGGLTAKGREYFNKKEGSHLRPGVQGPADTPEKMVRKGSFLRRHFAHPRGPMKNDKGEPTRLALSAHAWGEPVPQNLGDAKKLAAEGHELLEHYHEIKDGAQPGRTPAKKAPAKGAKKTAATTRHSARAASKKIAIKSVAGKKAVAKTAKKAATRKRAAKKSAAAKRSAARR